MRWLLSLLDAPFVVADCVFVNPAYRGTRLPARDRAGATERRDIWLRKPIRIHDARSLAEAPALEREGFQLLEAPIQLDFRNPELVTTVYYEHCAGLVRAATGCRAVKVLQHEFRDGTGQATYAGSAHADVSPFVEKVTTVPHGWHFGLFNIWRSIDLERPVEAAPLALCDIRTVASADMVYADAWRRTEPKTRVIDCRLIHDAGQSWCYFPRMTAEEALIFKQYDTRQEEPSLRAVYHTAFKDPTMPPEVTRRKTVEARVLAIFKEEDPEPEARRARFQGEVSMTRRDGTVSMWRHEEMIDWDKDSEPEP
ncbi:MAG: hypothetical protein F4092_03620 [Rhodospirillaceae bacterium]|nr:hypothetical protein [Rhodospirillaceae bacterium]